MKKSNVKNQTIVIVESDTYKLSAYYFLILIFLFLTGFLLFTGCSSKQKSLKKTETATAVIIYTKERSRGNRLPLYTIEVLDNKTVRYTGIANVPSIGERLIELKKADYQSLLQSFQAAKFNEFDTVYKGKKRDLPLTSITYNNHKVTYQEVACPKSLQALVSRIEKAVEK